MKTVEQKEKEAQVYLAKTAQHIFVNGKGEYWALVPDGNGNFKSVTGKETRTWEQLSKYANYYKEKKAYYKDSFFPKENPYHKRDNVYQAVRRSRVDPAFLELIGKAYPKPVEVHVSELVEA